MGTTNTHDSIINAESANIHVVSSRIKDLDLDSTNSMLTHPSMSHRIILSPIEEEIAESSEGETCSTANKICTAETPKALIHEKVKEAAALLNQQLIINLANPGPTIYELRAELLETGYRVLSAALKDEYYITEELEEALYVLAKVMWDSAGDMSKVERKRCAKEGFGERLQKMCEWVAPVPRLAGVVELFLDGE